MTGKSLSEAPESPAAQGAGAERSANAARDAQGAPAVRIKCVCAKGAVLPAYQTLGAAGADVRALLENPLVLQPMQRAAVPTGLFLEIPAGFEVQIRPRSGLALKNGVTCLNSPGTIDSDYRGELKIILANFGAEPFEVQNGERIAQMVVAPVLRADFALAERLSPTGRGAGGFGSTGK